MGSDLQAWKALWAKPIADIGSNNASDPLAVPATVGVWQTFTLPATPLNETNFIRVRMGCVEEAPAHRGHEASFVQCPYGAVLLSCLMELLPGKGQGKPHSGGMPILFATAIPSLQTTPGPLTSCAPRRSTLHGRA